MQSIRELLLQRIINQTMASDSSLRSTEPVKSATAANGRLASPPCSVAAHLALELGRDDVDGEVRLSVPSSLSAHGSMMPMCGGIVGDGQVGGGEGSCEL